MKNILCLTWSVLFFLMTSAAQETDPGGINTRTVYIDSQGIIRWDNNKEVALFGANYCLPSACDYRAAGYISADRKEMIDQDMTHFARMGWDGLRVCLWGDFENSDLNGNLVNNDHLDLMDYLIFKAKERGIYILFTPITTYNSQWPDALQDTASARGFSTYYKKSELGTNPEAIRAQINYIRQMLNHVNPYTGVAIKDEPSILFIEMINEPTHHSNDFKGSVRYINTLVKAVRSTGCNKLLFHNISQDMKMAPAIKASKVDGVSFAWYPMGLVSGHRLQGNHLRAVDDFSPMHSPELDKIPRIVYEFDEADSYTPYMYPAMMRAFRSTGAQFAAMFSYDMLATAPYNLGWQTHLMNMVFYPQKAVASIIAAEIMKHIPLYEEFGQYPDNNCFDPFRVSYEENLSEMVHNETFIYSNNTSSLPPDMKALKRIVGYGTSPVVIYNGKGIYFLDKVKDGVWRLELYPDAIMIDDPFEQPSRDKIVCRLISREWPMAINIPDLGKSFYITAVNKGNMYSTQSENGAFVIRPGVYILSAFENIALKSMPETIGNIGFQEYVCPDPLSLPASVIPVFNERCHSGHSVRIQAEVIDSVTPQDVSLYYRSAKYRKWFNRIPMQNTGAYKYEAIIPADRIREGLYKFCIVVRSNNEAITYPAVINKNPSEWDFYSNDLWAFYVSDEKSSLPLLFPENDVDYLAFTRIGDGGRQGIYDLIPDADEGRTSLRLYSPLNIDKALNDYSMSLVVKERIMAIPDNLADAAGITIRLRGKLLGQEAYITLVESDGTGWSALLRVTPDWNNLYIPFKDLLPARGVLLPLGFPGRWNYWSYPAKGRGLKGDSIKPDKIEKVQISIRNTAEEIPKDNAWVDVSIININFK